MCIAAEIAAERPDVKGPNTFRSALIDELYNLGREGGEGGVGGEVMRRARVSVVRG